MSYEVDNELFYEEEIEEMDENARKLNISSFQNTSTFNIDLNIDTVVSYYNRKKFVFDPEFQRRNVWDDNRKSKFIESLILNIPTPSILLADDKKRNEFIIIDGKQRLSTIIDFISPANSGNGFKLKNLEILQELNGYNYEKLLNDEEKIEFLSQLQNYPIKTSIVRNYDDALLYFIFARLNSGSVPLSTQELRHTIFPGDFSIFINKKSAENLNLKKILKLKKDKVDVRMKDAELLCRYYAFKYYLEQYDNTVGSLLDITYEKLNSTWQLRKDEIEKDLLEFDKSVEFIYEKFGEFAFKLYSTERKEYGQFNRLVFDLLTTHFSYEDNRERVNKSNVALKDFFESLFYIVEFSTAFKPVTSSKEKTLTRFKIFKEKFDLNY